MSFQNLAALEEIKIENKFINLQKSGIYRFRIVKVKSNILF